VGSARRLAIGLDEKEASARRDGALLPSREPSARMRPVRATEPRLAVSSAAAYAFALVHPSVHPTGDFRRN
jgi:hypothetical protein